MAEAFARAYFIRLDSNGEPEKDQKGKPQKINVQYNPTEFSMSKAAQIAEIGIPGIDSPILQFVRGQNETVTLELFFDTTEGGTGVGATSVTTETNKFYALVKMSGKEHAPPRCLFGWGEEFPGRVDGQGKPYGHEKLKSGTRKAFECIVESVQQKFTLFSPNGVPLRATLSVTLREYKSLKTQLDQLNLQSSHTRVHTVQRGETLPQIAYDVYQDAAMWSWIADENNILYPRNLEPGTVLRLPPRRT